MVKTVNITINGKKHQAEEGQTILKAAAAAGIDIPHLCYLKDINEIGACRMCCVEVAGEAKLVPACDNVVREGMEIVTNSPRVRKAVRSNLSLILSQHDGKCVSCVRSGNCRLQDLANDYNISEETFGQDLVKGKRAEWDMDFPLIRDVNKCIKCMRCIQFCDKIQTLGVWDLLGTGSRAHVGVSENRKITETDCSHCGQCITHCPVGALHERDDVKRVRAALDDPETVTVFQIAPAIRTAWGEPFGLTPEEAGVNRLAACLKEVGADYVFDTCFSADLTIMEEGNEFLELYTKGETKKYPLFTSCCPAWVRFMKSQFPEIAGRLSTAKSPQQMFGAVTKTYFAEKMGIDPRKLVCVSIMPCVAKKGECEIPSMQNKEGIRDVDFALTTREISRLLKAEHIHPEKLEDVPFDSILGDYSGAGVIFGTTGGVMEAALRTAYYVVMGENPDADLFKEVDGFNRENRPWNEKTFNLKGNEIKIAVTSGLGNARKLCEAILREEVHYDFVEVMACPGGCSGGGGQPIPKEDVELAEPRGKVLRKLDKGMQLRFSHENEEVQELYNEFLGKPLSEKAEELLHTHG